MKKLLAFATIPVICAWYLMVPKKQETKDIAINPTNFSQPTQKPKPSKTHAIKLDESLVKQIKTSIAKSDVDFSQVKVQLKNYNNLRSKVVKSQENLSELATLINSQELILDTARLLVNIKNMNGSKKNLEEMTLRMDAIDYLGLAYRAGSDETKLVALAAIKEILAKDWYEASISLDQRRIALGDQVELFELISDQDPRLANELIETEVSEKKQDLFRRSVAMRQHVMSG